MRCTPYRTARSRLQIWPYNLRSLYNVQWRSQRPSTIDEAQREDINVPRIGPEPAAIDFLEWGGNRAGFRTGGGSACKSFHLDANRAWEVYF